VLLYLLGFIRETQLVSSLQSMSVVVSMNLVVIAVAYDFGVVRAIVATFGRFLSGCLGTTPFESLTAATTVFLGLVIKSSLYGRAGLTAYCS